MKRLLCLLLTLLLLTGCGRRGTGQPSTSTGTFEPAGEETPSGEETPAEEAPEEPGLLDGRVALSEGSPLFRVPCEAVETGGYQDLFFYEDMLLATCLAYEGSADLADEVDLRLALLDRDTGEVLRETTLTGVSSPYIQVCGDTIAACDWGLGTVYLLDGNLHQTSGRRVAESWCSIYVSTDASAAYSFRSAGGILRTDLESGAEQVLLPSARELYASNRCGRFVTFSYVDGDTQRACYGVLDLSTGEILPVDFAGSLYSMTYSEGILAAGILYGEDSYLFGDPADPDVVSLPSATVGIPEGPVRLLTTVYDDVGGLTMTLYEKDGAFLSSCHLEDAWNYYLSGLLFSQEDGGYFFTATDYDGKVTLLFWDLSVPVTGEDLALVPLSTLTESPEGSAVSQELYDRAEALSAAYGVSIRIADQCDTEYYTYTVLQETDYFAISAGLDALETALSSYPDGFFSQFAYSTYREVEINLTGALTPIGMPDDANGFTSFAAFVEHHDDKQVMVLDLGQGSSLTQNFYHECSHLIDAKLAFDALYREDALFSEEQWAAMNPPGFAYTYDYYNLPEGIYSDGYDGYFVDTYARTYPTEDRARILEYAMAGYDWIFRAEGSEPLMEKLRYYAACIRDAFDTALWPEATAWEMPLQNPS